MVRRHTCLSVGLLLSLLASASVCAQQATAPAPAAANPTLSSSLGLFVFPAKNQNAGTQAGDEWNCFGWAKTQSGIDPLNIQPQTPATASAQASAPSAGGTVAKGAVGGALLGTAIGAIAGNTGKGAAIGATAGVAAGLGANSRNKSQAAQQQQQADAAAQQQAQASVAQQKATYNKAFSACMEGKGYTVK